MIRARAILAGLTALLAQAPAAAQDATPHASSRASSQASSQASSLVPDRARLLMTAGVSTVEGASGGGLVPWAVIGGYGTKDSWGASAFETRVRTAEYALRSRGVAVGFRDRVEFSFADQSFDTRERGAALGLGEGYTFEQAVYGAKLRLFGRMVADQGTPLPQVTLGVTHKRNRNGAVLKLIGAGDDEGTEVSLRATKLMLARGLVLTGGLRYTNANQLGLLGFGGDAQPDRTVQVEASAAYLLSRTLAVGAELRTKPDNLGFARESDAWSAFAAWFPSKHLSVTGAYVDLGPIAGTEGERGAYLSLQTGF